MLFNEAEIRELTLKEFVNETLKYIGLGCAIAALLLAGCWMVLG